MQSTMPSYVKTQMQPRAIRKKKPANKSLEPTAERLSVSIRSYLRRLNLVDMFASLG